MSVKREVNLKQLSKTLGPDKELVVTVAARVGIMRLLNGQRGNDQHIARVDDLHSIFDFDEAELASGHVHKWTAAELRAAGRDEEEAIYRWDPKSSFTWTKTLRPAEWKLLKTIVKDHNDYHRLDKWRFAVIEQLDREPAKDE